MQNGLAFVGFQEGLINFAPTFKYDVLRTLKRSKTKSSRHHWKHHADKHNLLYEAEEREQDRDDDEVASEFEGGEGASMASSIWTSVHSRPPTDFDDDELSGSAPTSQVGSAAVSNLAHKISIAAAAHKAKTKWMTLISPPPLTTSPLSSPRKTKYTHSEISTRNLPTPNITEPTPVTSTEKLAPPSIDIMPKSLSPESRKNGFLRPIPTRNASAKSGAQSGDDDTDDEDKGVYDSSNKKRVPSWYMIIQKACQFLADLQFIGAIEYCGSLLFSQIPTLKRVATFTDLAPVLANFLQMHSALVDVEDQQARQAPESYHSYHRNLLP